VGKSFVQYPKTACQKKQSSEHSAQPRKIRFPESFRPGLRSTPEKIVAEKRHAKATEGRTQVEDLLNDKDTLSSPLF
jgi:hypothetical protein